MREIDGGLETIKVNFPVSWHRLRRESICSTRLFCFCFLRLRDSMDIDGAMDMDVRLLE